MSVAIPVFRGSHISSMKSHFLLVLTLTFAIGTVVAGPIPPELAGEWTSPNAKFNRDILAKGTAIYLGADGFAAMLGADETDILGVAGTATLDAKTLTVTLRLRDDGTPPQRNKVTITYDPKAKTLTTKAAGDVTRETLTRRKDKIPKWVIDQTK